MKILNALSGLLILVALSSLALADKESKKTEPPKTTEPAEKQEGIQWTSYDKGLERAKAEEKHVFIDFTTSWCGWCKKMERETFSRPEVIEMMNENFIPVKVDGDSRNELNVDGFKITERNLTKREFGVRGYPTFWFLKPDGSKLGSLSGYKPTNVMMEALAFVKDYKYDSTRTETAPKEDN